MLFEELFILLQHIFTLYATYTHLSKSDESNMNKFYKYNNKLSANNDQTDLQLYNSEKACMFTCTYTKEQCIAIDLYQYEEKWKCQFYTSSQTLISMETDGDEKYHLSMMKISTLSCSLTQKEICGICDCVDGNSTNLPFYCDCRPYQKIISKDCNETMKEPFNISGVYLIQPKDMGNLTVFCELRSSTAYTTFMRRFKNSNFPTDKSEYQTGFGFIENAWLGLNAMYRLTNVLTTLRVEYVDYTLNLHVAEYKGFNLNGIVNNKISYHRFQVLKGSPVNLLECRQRKSFQTCSNNDGFWWDACHNITHGGTLQVPTHETNLKWGSDAVMLTILLKQEKSTAVFDRNCKDVYRYTCRQSHVFYSTYPNGVDVVKARCFFHTEGFDDSGQKTGYVGEPYIFLAKQRILQRQRSQSMNSSRQELTDGIYIDDWNYFIGFKNLCNLLSVGEYKYLYFHNYDLLDYKYEGVKILNGDNFELHVPEASYENHPYKLLRSSNGIQECTDHGGGWWWDCKIDGNIVAPTLQRKPFFINHATNYIEILVYYYWD